MRYAVFGRDETGTVRFLGASSSLGSGSNELAYIAAGHNLKPGDVIFIDGRWLRLESVAPATERIRPLDVAVSHLPELEDSAIIINGTSWSPAVAARLADQIPEELRWWAEREKRQRGS